MMCLLDPSKEHHQSSRRPHNDIHENSQFEFATIICFGAEPVVAWELLDSYKTKNSLFVFDFP